MRTIEYSEVIALKKAVRERFGRDVHFHDYCSDYAFTLEEPDSEVQAFVVEHFARRQRNVVFAADGVTFTVE